MWNLTKKLYMFLCFVSLFELQENSLGRDPAVATFEIIGKQFYDSIICDPCLHRFTMTSFAKKLFKDFQGNIIWDPDPVWF